MAAAARSAFSGDGPSANVLPIRIVAIPHVAMAQAGSRSSADCFFAGPKGEGMK
jgi:hypothetical protein